MTTKLFVYGKRLFERVQTVTGAGVRCWVYVWPGEIDGFEAIDVW